MFDNLLVIQMSTYSEVGVAKKFRYVKDGRRKFQNR